LLLLSIHCNIGCDPPLINWDVNERIAAGNSIVLQLGLAASLPLDGADVIRIRLSKIA
jgi:hypothetical protein